MPQRCAGFLELPPSELQCERLFFPRLLGADLLPPPSVPPWPPESAASCSSSQSSSTTYLPQEGRWLVPEVTELWGNMCIAEHC